MNRASRRRREANATPEQKRILAALKLIESKVGDGATLDIGIIGGLNLTTGRFIPHKVGMGAGGTQLAHSPAHARQIATFFDADQRVAAAGLGWIPAALRECADECERRDLAVAQPDQGGRA